MMECSALHVEFVFCGHIGRRLFTLFCCSVGRISLILSRYSSLALCSRRHNGQPKMFWPFVMLMWCLKNTISNNSHSDSFIFNKWQNWWDSTLMTPSKQAMKMNCSLTLKEHNMKSCFMLLNFLQCCSECIFNVLSASWPLYDVVSVIRKDSNSAWGSLWEDWQALTFLSLILPLFSSAAAMMIEAGEKKISFFLCWTPIAVLSSLQLYFREEPIC